MTNTFDLAINHIHPLFLKYHQNQQSPHSPFQLVTPHSSLAILPSKPMRKKRGTYRKFTLEQKKEII